MKKSLKNILGHHEGLSLIEVMIAMAILGVMATMAFMSMQGMIQGQELSESIDEANRGGTLILSKMRKDLQSAFSVTSKDMLPQTEAVKYAFVGNENQIDFVSFANVRYFKNQKESEVVELGYLLKPDSELNGVSKLYRRHSAKIDDKPNEGGRLDLLANNVFSLRFEYYDHSTKEYKSEWDTSGGGNAGNLPKAVKVTLVLLRSLEEDDLSDEANRHTFYMTVPIPLSGGALDL